MCGGLETVCINATQFHSGEHLMSHDRKAACMYEICLEIQKIIICTYHILTLTDW